MAVIDHHVHSSYSDGEPLEAMVRAAARAELDGVGVADHCNVTSERIRTDRGYFLHESYRQRRAEIESLRGRYDVPIYDAVEVDYYPHDERRIEAFLDAADFDFTIGSIHYVEDHHVANEAYFGAKSRSERSRLVDTYVDSLVALIESGLFDIAAHLDVLERYDPFRDLVGDSHYRMVADALADSRTTPELNVGRVFSEYGKTHPKPAFADHLHRRGVEFVFGTDAHTPEELLRCVDYYENVLDRSEYTFTTTEP